MSFLDSNNSDYVSVRITQKGRNAIAQGNFKISYFQIGDSEYDYTNPFSGYTGLGSVPGQKVMAPFDKESGVKYPYKFDASTPSTTYGIPVQNALIEPIRNIMGPAGFVSNYIPFDIATASGTTVACSVDVVNMVVVNGSNTLYVDDSTLFQNCEYITILFGDLGGTDPNLPVITDTNYNSLIYKVTGISTNYLYLDRNMPNLSSISSNAQVICNKCEVEGAPLSTLNTEGQLNPWTLNIVWGDKPIGADVSGTDEGLTGYTSNIYASAKELLGYTSTGQTFTDFTGNTISDATSFITSFGEVVDVPPNEQRCVAIVHYSDLNDVSIDPERFWKYDDYISYDTNLFDSIITDSNDIPISDTEYFEVYIPFIHYHRNTSTTIGAIFKMDVEDYYIKSTKNEKHALMYRYLLDEQGFRVGKVFPKNKIFVFDDQELVAMLDYRSNRRYTLPAPKVSTVASDTTPENSMLTGSTGQTVWVTYMFQYTGDTQLNSLPCNYFMKTRLDVNGNACLSSTPSQVTFKLNTDSLPYMETSFTDVKYGFIADKFYILVQITNTGDLPSHDLWKIIDYTSVIPNHTIGQLIDQNNLYNHTFTIYYSGYTGASFFDLETYLKTTPSDTNYLGDTTWTTQPQFGDEQPFPGSVRLIRASDLAVMNFQVNLPSSQFLETQNPTYVSGEEKKITEVALLNDNKEVMIIAKISNPLTRSGAQVISVRMDF
jgi:hypothetical protein